MKLSGDQGLDRSLEKRYLWKKIFGNILPFVSQRSHAGLELHETFTFKPLADTFIQSTLQGKHVFFLGVEPKTQCATELQENKYILTTFGWTAPLRCNTMCTAKVLRSRSSSKGQIKAPGVSSWLPFTVSAHLQTDTKPAQRSPAKCSRHWHLTTMPSCCLTLINGISEKKRPGAKACWLLLWVDLR